MPNLNIVIAWLAEQFKFKFERAETFPYPLCTQVVESLCNFEIVFATGLVGVRSPYGAPLNAVDQLIVPGGSSSGSAVSVGHGIVSFSLGTDTAGSGRVPAALNNIVGLKLCLFSGMKWNFPQTVVSIPPSSQNFFVITVNIDTLFIKMNSTSSVTIFSK